MNGDTACFENEVALKYRLYNSLFLTLPFSDLSRYGAQLPLFAQHCSALLEKGKRPEEIVHSFLRDTLAIPEEEEEALLFLFLQLIERQVLLFDAVEAAAHESLYSHRIEELLEELVSAIGSSKSLRLVLTAHPTQFYPEELLGVIRDLSAAVGANDVVRLRKLLLQLGRTAFRRERQPTPLEEAEMLIDRYLPLLMQSYLDLAMRWKEKGEEPPRLELGFWPGGDRDGHPLVTVETTRAVAERLREAAIRFHLRQAERLHQRITFKGSAERVRTLRARLRASLRQEEGAYEQAEELIHDLDALHQQVSEEHEALFCEEIARMRMGVALFGFYLASLDIRQDSAVQEALFGSAYRDLSEEARCDFLERDSIAIAASDDLEKDLLAVMKLLPEVQKKNGKMGAHRYIISHCEAASHLLEAFHLSGGAVDVVPLFESIRDLQDAPLIMKRVLQSSRYRQHLRARGDSQTVMVGFSDGTKDGGYVTCNREIQRCKEQLTALGREEEVHFIFFDGRGGPPARGGGHTHTYYAAVAEQIPLDEIQLTVQGQSISSFYGTEASAKHNLLQLLAAFAVPTKQQEEEPLLAELAERSFNHYQTLREDPGFIPLLAESTPLTLLGELNIASRPTSRSSKKSLSLENLRAISFVGAWSLMKVNLPAFYGLGLALEEVIRDGRLEELHALYERSAFFRALLGNAGQALRKSLEPLTRYLEEDPKHSKLWTKIREELNRAVEKVQLVSGRDQLMEPGVGEASVALREEIILPLLVIQHDAIQRWRKNPDDEVVRKRLLKSIPASINASRNSA